MKWQWPHYTELDVINVVVKTGFYRSLGAKDTNAAFLKLDILGKVQGDGSR